ncbi:hypothetical protein DVR14_20915 (plasmid) [Natrinema thermotolerans]|nr:hypothetical protein DVR14_16795 [Natrinema thermotolerans]QCC61106.1 hypothetical protein DVR14_20915 [Natrinema thermotolerans]
MDLEAMSEYDGTENPDTPWREDGTGEHDNRGDDGVTGGDKTPFEPNRAERGTWLSAAIALVGLAVLGQAFVLELAAGQFWNDVFVGATLSIAGAYNYVRRTNGAFGSMGVAVLAALVGLWLVATTFLLGAGSGGVETASEPGFWIDVVAGLLATALGTYSVVRIRNRRRAVDVRPTAT